MIKKAEWLAIAKDRTAIILLVTLIVAAIALLVTTVLRVHPSEVQIPVRYTSFGVNSIYRDQWYTQLSYIGFAFLVVIINAYLAIRLYKIRRLLGLGLLGMSVFVLVVAVVIANAIFNLAPAI